MNARIRFVDRSDLSALTRIYNHYIVETPTTFDVATYSDEERRPWLEQFAPRSPYQCFVAEVNDEAIGWASSGPFRPKAAYHRSVEVSVYLAPDAAGNRLGTRLYDALFASLAKEHGLRRALAGITKENPASVALHTRCGFSRVGVFTEVGWKFDRYWDVEWFEKRL